jgi:hypothetical protein
LDARRALAVPGCAAIGPPAQRLTLQSMTPDWAGDDPLAEAGDHWRNQIVISER